MHEAAVFVRMQSTDSEWFYTTLENKNVLNPSRSSIQGATDNFKALTAERDELFVRLKKYKVFKKNLEEKVSEQDVIVKAMTRSVKHLKRKVSSSQDQNNLLRKINEEMMGNYGKYNTVVRKIKKVAKTVPARFVEMVMFISRTIPECCLPQILDLKQSGEHRCQNWTGHWKQSTTHAIEVIDRKCVVLMDPLWLVCVMTYKQSLISEIGVLLALAEMHFDSME